MTAELADNVEYIVGDLVVGHQLAKCGGGNLHCVARALAVKPVREKGKAFALMSELGDRTCECWKMRRRKKPAFCLKLCVVVKELARAPARD